MSENVLQPQHLALGFGRGKQWGTEGRICEAALVPYCISAAESAKDLSQMQDRSWEDEHSTSELRPQKAPGVWV